MEQKLTVTTTVSSIATLVFSTEPSPAPDMVTARLMKTAPETFVGPSTTGLWATAVWGTKPAQDVTPDEFPLFWDSSAVRSWYTRGCNSWTANSAATFLLETVPTSRYGAN